MIDEDRQEIFKERERRNSWWRELKVLREEYITLVDSVAGQFDVDDFDTFLASNFGIKINYDQSGNILSDYQIVDKNKHLIFLMKYRK